MMIYCLIYASDTALVSRCHLRCVGAQCAAHMAVASSWSEGVLAVGFLLGAAGGLARGGLAGLFLLAQQLGGLGGQGVVGVLQFDVLKYRLENEYNVEIRMDNLPYEHIRWIENEEVDMDKLVGTSDMKKIQDLKGRPLLLFVNAWSVGMVLDRNKGLALSEFGRE